MIDKKEQYLVAVAFRYTVTGQCRVTQSSMIYGYVISPTSLYIPLLISILVHTIKYMKYKYKVYICWWKCIICTMNFSDKSTFVLESRPGS